MKGYFIQIFMVWNLANVNIVSQQKSVWTANHSGWSISSLLSHPKCYFQPIYTNACYFSLGERSCPCISRMPCVFAPPLHPLHYLELFFLNALYIKDTKARQLPCSPSPLSPSQPFEPRITNWALASSQSITTRRWTNPCPAPSINHATSTFSYWNLTQPS